MHEKYLTRNHICNSSSSLMVLKGPNYTMSCFRRVGFECIDNGDVLASRTISCEDVDIPPLVHVVIDSL